LFLDLNEIRKEPSFFFEPAEKEEKSSWNSLQEKFSIDKNPELWFPLQVPKGSVVVIHGSLVHMSEKNKSPYSRHAYTFHMIESGIPYSDENWLQRPLENPFRSMILK